MCHLGSKRKRREAGHSGRGLIPFSFGNCLPGTKVSLLPSQMRVGRFTQVNNYNFKIITAGRRFGEC